MWLFAGPHSALRSWLRQLHFRGDVDCLLDKLGYARIVNANALQAIESLFQFVPNGASKFLFRVIAHLVNVSSYRGKLKAGSFRI